MGEVLRASMELKAKISRPIFYRAETTPQAMTLGKVTSAIMTAKPGARTLITSWSLLRGQNVAGAGTYTMDDGGGLTLAAFINPKNQKYYQNNPFNTRVLNRQMNGSVQLEEYILLKDNEQMQCDVTSLIAGNFTYSLTFTAIEFLF